MLIISFSANKQTTGGFMSHTNQSIYKFKYVRNISKRVIIVSVFTQDAPLVYTSLRRFKIYQPEELEMLNISPLMEECISLLPTITAIFINTRQSP